MRKLKYDSPEIGTQYGQWTIISRETKKNSPHRQTYYKVKCECGREGWRSAALLVSEKVKACKSCCRSSMFKNTFTNSYFNKIIDRAKKMNFEIDIDSNYLYDLFLKQNKKCKLSGEDIDFRKSWEKGTIQTASLDRINNNKGYIKGNVQFVHKDVNFMKGKLTEERFIELCNKISKYEN